jgi:hypothetical protein
MAKDFLAPKAKKSISIIYLPCQVLLARLISLPIWQNMIWRMEQFGKV